MYLEPLDVGFQGTQIMGSVCSCEELLDEG